MKKNIFFFLKKKRNLKIQKVLLIIEYISKLFYNLEKNNFLNVN